MFDLIGDILYFEGLPVATLQVGCSHRARDALKRLVAEQEYLELGKQYEEERYHESRTWNHQG